MVRVSWQAFRLGGCAADVIVLSLGGSGRQDMAL